MKLFVSVRGQRLEERCTIIIPKIILASIPNPAEFVKVTIEDAFMILDGCVPKITIEPTTINDEVCYNVYPNTDDIIINSQTFNKYFEYRISTKESGPKLVDVSDSDPELLENALDNDDIVKW